MDTILAKHLANTFLFPEQIETKPLDKNNIAFSSYKIIDEKFYIKAYNQVIVSKVKGYWNNKPVITVNGERYALLEGSKSLVNLNSIGVTTLTPEPLKEEVEANQDNETVKEIKSPNSTPGSSTTRGYLPKQKASESSVSTTSEEDKFFKTLEQFKDDPRLKQIFNYHAELAKKEIFQITEKFTQQQMARAMESGGGTNAVQYANGGTMKGNLVIDGNLSVVGKINEGTANNDVTAKKIFLIGDNTSKEYTVTHGLDTKDVLVALYDTNDEQVFASVKNISLNETKITFSVPITTNSIKVVIIG